MASNSASGYSEEIMVAQPGGSILAADASSTMSPGREVKEAGDGEAMSDILEYSEDSPEQRAVNRARSSTPRGYLRLAGTPRFSPSPSSSRGRVRNLKGVSVRSISLKRSTSTLISLPMMPRVGRAAVTDAAMWGDSGRIVLRKVEHPGD